MVATDKGEETHRRILDVAATHFSERGYTGTSLNDLIRATGLTKGGFYFHFDSKEALALAVLDDLRGHWRDQILAAAGSHERAVDEIAAIVRALVRLKAEHPENAAIGKLCVEFSSEPAMAEHVNHFQGWFELTERLLRRAQAEGDLDPAVDPGFAARYVVGAYLGAEMLSDFEGADRMAREIDGHLACSFRAIGVTTR